MKEKQKKPSRSRIGLLGLFLRGSVGWFLLSVAAVILLTLAESLTPHVISFTVDSVLGDEPAALNFLSGRLVELFGGRDAMRSELWRVALLLICLAAVAAVARYATRVTNVRGGEQLVKRMRDLLFGHIQHLPFSWHMKNQTGDIIQRCTSDVEMVKNFVSEQMTSMIRLVALAVLPVAFMVQMSPLLTLIALSFAPVIIVYSLIYHAKFGELFRTADENEGLLSAVVQENLTGARVVRAFAREEFEKNRFDRQNNFYTETWVKLSKIMSLFWSIGDLMTGLQVLLILTSGTVFCLNGQITVGNFIAFLSYNAMLMWPIRMAGRMIAEMSKAGVSIDRIGQILNEPAEADRPGAVDADLRGDIVFSHVTFAYDKLNVLDDVSVTIPGGKVFGILGGTGSGKSTLMLLLDRLYELGEGGGTVTVGGIDVRNIRLDCLRRNVGIVLQEPFLFSRTLGENIAIAREGLAAEELRAAARVAALDETVMEFPKQYETEVGERGVTLSGGQKQRVAIARMLTEKTPIMIFDDSLSAVDAETDAKIREALKGTFGNATVILISHRISTLMQADRIMVMDNGRVAELGTHRELLEKGGLYRRIYDIQQNITDGEDDT